jgi:hypothetical protein
MPDPREPRRPETNYELVEVGSTTVARISDVSDDRAWIQSTVTVDVRR